MIAVAIEHHIIQRQSAQEEAFTVESHYCGVRRGRIATQRQATGHRGHTIANIYIQCHTIDQIGRRTIILKACDSDGCMTNFHENNS